MTAPAPSPAPRREKIAVLSEVDAAVVADALRGALSDLTDPPGWHPETSECPGCPTCNEVVPMLKHALEKLDDPAADSGLARIASERRRQVNVEGWTPEHDAEHFSGELSIAAACYAINKLPAAVDIQVTDLDFNVDAFPWEGKFDKREQHDRLRSLEIAGALIAAEIDRILRDEKRAEGTT